MGREGKGGETSVVGDETKNEKRGPLGEGRGGRGGWWVGEEK